MKHTKQLLAATLVLTPALLAFVPRGTALTFSVAEGTTNTKTFSNVAELTMDDMSMLLNGQESPAAPSMEMSINSKFLVSVSDTYSAMGQGQPKRLKRTYDSIEQSADISMEIDVMGNVQSNDMSIPAKSELEGVEVLFSWDADADDFVASYPEEEGDQELLEGLLEDMDLRAFLPPGEVALDDEWTVSPSALIGVLAPGGDLKILPEEVAESADAMAMNPEMGDFSNWFSEDMEGQVKAVFKGTRETEDGAKVGVIEITIEITNAVDMTESMEDSVQELPDGAGEMEVTGMELGVELEGEATLLWDLAAGCAHSFEMTGDLGLTMDVAMDISTQGMDMEVEQSMEFSGSVTSTASIE